MIVECPGCQSRYDVSGRPPGTRARCRCSTVFTLPEPEQRASQLSCPSCGGNVSPGARECEYCSATLLVKACPRCFARVFHGAKHCNHCGAHVEIPATATADGTAVARACPVCKDGTTLQGRLSGKFLLDECPACHGLFVDAAALERIIRDREDVSVQQVVGLASGGPDAAPQSPLQAPPRPPGRPMYIKCPDCEGLMNRRNFGHSSGIIVDVCRAHGTWFDANELPSVIEFVSTGGLDEARAKKHARQREEVRRAEAQLRVQRMTPARASVGSHDVGAFEGLLSVIGKVLSDS